MKNYLFSVLVLIITVQAVFAQTKPQTKQRCGTTDPPAKWDEWFNQQVEIFKQSETFKKGQSTNYTIPVVFHVVHGGQSEGTFPNLSQAQVNSQILILNDDFAGTGLNVGNFSSTTFAPSLIANCNITFCLAEKDPGGATLTQKGIHRVNYTSNGWANPASFTSNLNFKNYIDNTLKPNTIWDPTRYLNVWCTDVNAAIGLLGFATFPSNSTLSDLTTGFGTSSTDGVWCWSAALGNTGSVSNPFDEGRTLTHEVGHWVGLRHIWGDSNCGDDYCNDTPTQQSANTGCPNFPKISCSNGPKGDMFMNFMDYCDDACLYMFTPDQRTRIQTAMANCPFRTQLTASSATLCGSIVVSCADTISNFTSSDVLYAYRRATASPTDACPQGAGMAGYICGTNCYGDLEKAQFISVSKYSAISSPVITGVIVLFFQYGNMGTDWTANLSMKIYDGSSGSPGALLGSKSENLATIAATTNTNAVSYCGNPSLAFPVPLIMPFKFVFSSPIAAPATGGFFASMEIPNTPGDTVSIIDANAATANTAWEKYSDGNWYTMFSSWGNSVNFKLAILPIMDCTTGGVEKTINEEQLNIFPNPGNGKFNLFTNFKGEQQLQINVYNLYGKKVQNKRCTVTDESLTELDLESQAQGVYFVEIQKGSEKITKKVILQK